MLWKRRNMRDILYLYTRGFQGIFGCDVEYYELPCWCDTLVWGNMDRDAYSRARDITSIPHFGDLIIASRLVIKGQSSKFTSLLIGYIP